MLILTCDSIGAKHIHHLTVVRLSLIEGSVLEQTMLFDPCAVDDDFRLLVGGSELGRDMCNAVFLFDLLLYLLSYAPTCGVGFKTAGLDLIPYKDFHQPSVHDVRQSVVAYTIVNIVVLSVHIRHG